MLGVYFKDIKLGELEYINGMYAFRCNHKNVQKCRERGYLVSVYGCEDDFISHELPLAISEFIPPAEIEDLNLMAGINELDTEFEKLCKMAKLNLATEDFYIKYED